MARCSASESGIYLVVIAPEYRLPSKVSGHYTYDIHSHNGSNLHSQNGGELSRVVGTIEQVRSSSGRPA